MAQRQDAEQRVQHQHRARHAHQLRHPHRRGADQACEEATHSDAFEIVEAEEAPQAARHARHRHRQKVGGHDHFGDLSFADLRQGKKA